MLQVGLSSNVEAADMLNAPFLERLAEQEVQQRQQDDMDE